MYLSSGAMPVLIDALRFTVFALISREEQIYRAGTCNRERINPPLLPLNFRGGHHSLQFGQWPGCAGWRGMIPAPWTIP